MRGSVGHTTKTDAGDTIIVNRRRSGQAVANMDIQRAGPLTIVAAADGADNNLVVIINIQTADSSCGVGDNYSNSCQRGTVLENINFIAGSTIVVPANVGRGGIAAVEGQTHYIGAARNLGNGDVVNMEVVVTTTGSRLCIEGNSDSVAKISIQVDYLIHIASASKRSESIVATLILPLGSVGFKPSVATVSRDNNHKGLAAVTLKSAGSGSTIVTSKYCIETQLCRGSSAQVNSRSNDPALARCTINIFVIVTSFNTTVHT